MSELRRQSSGYTLIELMMVIAIIGVLAAIAIPSFNRYIKRVKTQEALLHLRHLFDASVSYYHTTHVMADGQELPRQFPTSVACTPDLSAIGSKQATPDPSLWEHHTWNDLSFAVRDPHYFAYQYDSSGTGLEAQFGATAFGNLDDDDVYSTFVRLGSITGRGEVKGRAGVYLSRELE